MKVTLHGINEHSSGLCYQRRLGNSNWIPASYTGGNLSILICIQHAEFCCRKATTSIARRAVERGHLFLSALTCPSSGNVMHVK